MANSQWDTPEQREHVEAVVREYPIKPGEGQYHYIVRLALEAGLVREGEGVRRWPAQPVARTVAEVREDLRLPYKEPREPGEDG